MTSSQNRADRLAHDLEQFTVPVGTLAIWSLGHAGFAFRWPDSGLVLLDPYLSGRIERLDPATEFKRRFPPVLAPERLHADLVLITHRHDDHLDLDTLVPLSSGPKPPLIAAPEPSHRELRASGLERVRDVVAGQRFTSGPLVVTPVRAFHGDEGGELGPCFGFLMEAHGLRVCHTGDTLVTPELVETLRAFRPHVLIAPTNGADYFRTSRNIIGNMNGREAVELARQVNADLLIPTHYDLFPNNTENQAFLVDHLLSHRPEQSFHLLRAGERFLYAAPGYAAPGTPGPQP
ncbi:MBL fold metallo-hydrolase [Deinococcus altitudinis]|uniref:MBL fold metallo-hydrolase n=1 Tax=Deinococcus altitudinis TaxID=468914 RepID=UPI0038924D87